MAKLDRDFSPIFVHASARSGSTYFFDALRRDDLLLCFKEAIIDGKMDYARFRRNWQHANNDHSRFRRNWLRGNAGSSHAFLDRPDFEEFIEAWEEVMYLCPEFPEFENYLPPQGLLADNLKAYFSALINYARSKGRRPVFCETNSRGRAGALRNAFGGFHIAQYRDPLCQFGSLLRSAIEKGFLGFLAKPLKELGVNRNHPLYLVVPEEWRAPHFSWDTTTRATRWASDARYVSLISSGRPEDIRRAFHWHLFSWFLTNLASISYCDLNLDIDRLHDDEAYRASFSETVARLTGASPNLSKLSKFERYYRFSFFDIEESCLLVAATISAALGDGRLERAIKTLGREPLETPVDVGAQILLKKLDESLASIASSKSCLTVTADDWYRFVGMPTRIKYSSTVRRISKNVYPVAQPILHAVRRAARSVHEWSASIAQ